VIAGVGAAYWTLVQRRKHAEAPEVAPATVA
jgi:hypothetical protein